MIRNRENKRQKSFKSAKPTTMMLELLLVDDASEMTQYLSLFMTFDSSLIADLELF